MFLSFMQEIFFSERGAGIGIGGKIILAFFYFYAIKALVETLFCQL